MAENEVSVTGDGLVVKGEIVEDIRPVVRRMAKTADSVLRLFDNLVGIPLDYASNNLERFRRRYAERFEEIPLERRREPPMRIGCAVVKNVAYAADEDDIQELFANLLASASDTEHVVSAHPGFATVIGELRSLDARILRAMATRKWPQPLDPNRIQVEGEDPDHVAQSLSNLVRLGLLDWRDAPPDLSGIRTGALTSRLAIRPEEIPNLAVKILNDYQQFKQTLLMELKKQPLRLRRLEVTSFGRNFIIAAIRPVEDAGAAPDQNGQGAHGKTGQP